jgi:hypothetical protein
MVPAAAGGAPALQLIAQNGRVTAEGSRNLPGARKGLAPPASDKTLATARPIDRTV